jgi:hypothetical protein
LRWTPEIVGQSCDALERHAFAEGECRGGIAQHKQSADAYNHGSAALQVCECTLYCRTGIDHVVDNCDALTPKSSPKGRRNPICNREKAALGGRRTALGIREMNIKL